MKTENVNWLVTSGNRPVRVKKLVRRDRKDYSADLPPRANNIKEFSKAWAESLIRRDRCQTRS
jgi:hypothetical protein